MWTTGLVSLSIHDTLTFDGIEIALHPDLFSDSTAKARPSVVGRSLGNASVSSSATTAMQKPHHHRNTSDSAALVADDGDGRPPIMNSASFASAPSVSNRRLEVGDLIEIRVWDPLPGSEKSSPQGFRKRRSPPASKDSSRVGSSSNSVTNETPPLRKLSSTSATLEAAASSLQQSKASSASLQYSVDSSFPVSDKKEEESKECDASTVSSTEKSKETIGLISNPPSPKGNVPNTVTAPADDSRPPTFPRARSETADGIPRPITSKPPTVQRSRTSATTSLPGEAGESRRRQAPNPPKLTHVRDISDMTMDTVHRRITDPNKPAGHHVRDISDMTADTVLGSHIVPDATENTDDGDGEDDTLSRIAATHAIRLSVVMMVTEKTLTSLKESARTQVSILRQIADLYNLSSYDMVTVNRINKSEETRAMKGVSADFVTVTIKEQYISRGDMHFFQKSLIGKWIYEGQRLGNTTKGVNAHAREIRHQKRLAKSGIITEDTMITFRSRSARIFWLVQISSEMWDYASPYSGARNEESSCEIYFDKFVTFMHRLFKKWQDLEVTHSLTVVFFSRTYLSTSKGVGQGRTHVGKGSESAQENGSGPGGKDDPFVNVDVCGRLYEDHFKTVIENETNADWDSLIARIKREFVRYPFDVSWNLSDENGRRPSTAAQGNILEAVNVTLNLMQFHYLDRDLHRVGNSLVIVSPGCGVFEVDRDLAGITYQRMMDNGIGSDMLSLGLPPLHTAPFFHYNNDLFSVEAQGVDTEKKYHEVPHWMHLSFFSYDDEDHSQGFGLTSETIELPIGKAAKSSASQDIEIGPNGFYIPNMRSEKEYTLISLESRRASFSALANVAASPTISQSRQRQLIEGRAFNDILEACHPRRTQHTFPSALSSLLRMYESTQKQEDPCPTDSKAAKDEECPEKKERHPADGDTRIHMKEWGAIDMDEVSTIISQSPTTLSMKMLQNVASSLPRDQGSDDSSPPSSFSSHMSSLLSRSFERAVSIHSYHSSGFQFRSRTMTDGIQLQRSPSMDSFELEDEIEETTASSGDGSVDEEHDSALTDRPGGTVSDVHKNVHSGARSEADHLRTLMKQQDKRFFLRNQVNADDKTTTLGDVRPSDRSDLSTKNISPSSTAGAPQAVGGLGAALRSYNSTSRDKKLVAPVSHEIKRNRSVGKLRDVNQRQSPFSLSRSLGPLQGTPPSASNQMLRLPGRGSDPPEELSTPRVSMQGMRGIRIKGASSTSLISTSPPSRRVILKQPRSPHSFEHNGSPPKRGAVSRSSKRRSHTLNPFKQQDEEVVLAEKSHNRRRWSHVFPIGEVEFKRHAGPNWKSLCQPAILPLTIDYYPPPQELNSFLIRPWDIPLADIEKGNYKSHSDLMMEMIRQRLTQDYQIVPQSVVQESRRRAEAVAQLVAPDRTRIIRADASPSPAARSFLSPDNVTVGRVRLLKSQSAEKGASADRRQGPPESKIIEHHLSMGHTLHVLKYDPNAEEKKIIVEQLSRRRTDRTFQYKYMIYSPSMKKYVKVVQQFHEFSYEYRWNQVDHLIGGIEDKNRTAEMKFRRVMFALIPDSFADTSEEQNYIDKFRKLLDYLNKLREDDETGPGLEVKIISSDNDRGDPKSKVASVRREVTDVMKRLTVQLRKGKRDPYEWLDIAVEPTFDTRRSYRVLLQWLAASSGKVDSQIQLIHRRCTQFGLKLITIPHLSISPNLFLNPLNAPSILCIRAKDDANLVDDALLSRNFVDDGIHMTEKTFLDCIENASDYNFGRRRRVPARQFVHRSGTLFVRLIRDENGLAVLASIENRRLIGLDDELLKTARYAFRQIENFHSSLPSVKENKASTPAK